MDLIIAACRALANRTRLQLLRAIHERPERTVQILADEVGLGVPEVSKHLKLLRGFHLIRTTPQGRYVRCSPAQGKSTNSVFLQELQEWVKDLFATRELNRTLGQVCDLTSPTPREWDTVFDAMIRHATTFTHLRRLLLLRWLANKGPSRPQVMATGVGMSPDAVRRHLDKLRRRGVIASTGGTSGAWALVCAPDPAARARLLTIVLRALRNH